jgi:hypothetical protein
VVAGVCLQASIIECSKKVRSRPEIKQGVAAKKDLKSLVFVVLILLWRKKK